MGQHESKRVKIGNDSDDHWVWDFEMHKFMNAYHTFVLKKKKTKVW
jgi:hypothetical protein